MFKKLDKEPSSAEGLLGEYIHFSFLSDLEQVLELDFLPPSPHLSISLSLEEWSYRYQDLPSLPPILTTRLIGHIWGQGVQERQHAMTS